MDGNTMTIADFNELLICLGDVSITKFKAREYTDPESGQRMIHIQEIRYNLKGNQ